MNLDLSGRQTRSIGIRFMGDDKTPQQSLNETIRASLDDLLKAQGDVSYVAGVKAAVGAIAHMLTGSGISLPNWSKQHFEPWLAHVVARSPNCTCTLEDDGYDNVINIEHCPRYSDRANQRLWYLAYHGLTEEELIEQEREEARKAAEKKARDEELRRTERLRQLHQLAEESGVDPKLLP